MALVAVAGTLALSSCARLGFTDRVLWRVPSPDTQYVAVCQERPELDGPGYQVRLERPDGTFVRSLYEIGDGDPCSEMAWSPDGRMLAVLSSHVARLRFIDVGWALEQPNVDTAYWTWRQVDLSRAGQPMFGRDIRFDSASRVRLNVCPYELGNLKRTGSPTCSTIAVARVIDVPAQAFKASR